MTVNLINPEAISAYLLQQSEGDQELAARLEAAIGKDLRRREESATLLTSLPEDAPAWLQNKWDVCGPFHTFVPDAELDDKILHVKDWLVSAKRQGQEIEVHRLQKLGTLSAALAAADKYFSALNKNAAALFENDGDIDTIMTFPDGSRIVQLLTTDALHIEGAGMGHCVGGGSYDEELATGRKKFYSLRDAQNKPHVTFEVKVEGGELLQCKGKENAPPVQKYIPMVQEFVLREKLVLKEKTRYTGLVQDVNGMVYSVLDLPDTLHVKGNLDLDGMPGLTSLPENLVVEGTLDLSDCTGLKQLSGQWMIKDALLLDGCRELETLPDDLTVGGHLFINHKPYLRALPKKLQAGKNFFLSHCDNITDISSDIRVGETFAVDNCHNLKKISGKLDVGTTIGFRECPKLVSLPGDLVVRKSLNLVGSDNVQLPENLNVPDYFYLQSTSKKIPETITAGTGFSTDIGFFKTAAELNQALESSKRKCPWQRFGK